MKVPALFKNKYVLYALLFVGVVNVLGYVALKDYESLTLLMALGLLMGYFSKNMAVNIFVAVLVTSLMAVNKKVREGFEGKKEQEKEETQKEGMKSAKQFKCAKETFCPKGQKCTNQSQCKSETFKNNVPPSTPAKVSDDDDESPGDRIDYAATMEMAYDNLQKMLGEGGMKNITAETKKLVAQQKDLMGTLNSMAPVLDSAKETLKNIDLTNMGGISKMLDKLNGNQQKLSKDKK